MRKTMCITIAGLLTVSLAAVGVSPVIAQAAPSPGVSGGGYQSETSVRNPTSVPSSDLGSQRALRMDNVLTDRFLAGLNQFSMKTTAAVLKDGQENKNFSPISLYYALSLAAQGAGGSTKEQLVTLLGAPDKDLSQLAEGCGRLYRLMYQDDAYTKLKPANSLWLQNGLPLQDAYRRTAESQYYASVFRVNFADENTGGIIGKWIADQTNQSITPEPKAYENEVMRIVNTVNYQNEWTYEFKREDNTDGAFRLADGQQASCTYMTGLRSSSYLRGEGFLRATLSLKDNGTMLFILPDEGTDIQTLLSSDETMQQLFSPVSAFDSYGSVSWKVPKFRFTASMELKPMLESLGATDSFDTQKADFSGINGEHLYMQNVIQETVIGIDEKGVEASAYTMIAMGAGSAASADTLEMNLDRPFLYAILTDPGVPLFIGVCYNPTV